MVNILHTIFPFERIVLPNYWIRTENFRPMCSQQQQEQHSTLLSSVQTAQSLWHHPVKNQNNPGLEQNHDYNKQAQNEEPMYYHQKRRCVTSQTSMIFWRRRWRIFRRRASLMNRDRGPSSLGFKVLNYCDVILIASSLPRRIFAWKQLCNSCPAAWKPEFFETVFRLVFDCL